MYQEREKERRDGAAICGGYLRRYKLKNEDNDSHGKSVKMERRRVYCTHRDVSAFLCATHQLCDTLKPLATNGSRI